MNSWIQFSHLSSNNRKRKSSLKWEMMEKRFPKRIKEGRKKLRKNKNLIRTQTNVIFANSNSKQGMHYSLI